MFHAHFAIGLIRIPRGCSAQRIGSAKHRQIDVSTPQPLNIAQRWINASKAACELSHRLLKRIAGIGHCVTEPVRAGAKANDTLGKSVGTAFAIACPIPTGQQLLRFGKLRRIFQVKRRKGRHPSPYPALFAVGHVHLDREQLVWRDRRIGSQQLSCAQAPVGHAKFNTQIGGIGRRVHFGARPSRQKRRIVGVLDKARRWVHNFGISVKANWPGPHNCGRVARQQISIIIARFAVWKERIVDIGNAARFIGVDKVGGGNAANRHGFAPLGPIGRLCIAIILLNGFNAVDTGIADSEIALVILNHWPVDRTVHCLRHGQSEWPHFDGQPDTRRCQRQPFAVVPIFVTGLIHHQFVHIGKVGAVDGVGPPKIAVMAKQHEGRSWE